MLSPKLNFINFFIIVFFIFISFSLSAQTPQPPAKKESDKYLTFTAIKTPTSAPKENLIIYPRRHALCIGINDYKSPDIDDLQYSENDAKELSSILKEEYGFDDIVLLLGKDATKDKIKEEIGKFMSQRRIGKDDCVVIFFSGHGQTVDTGTRKDGYLIPQDALIDINDIKDPTPYYNYCLRMQDLKTDLEAIPAKHVLFLADSCYSGYIAPKTLVETADIINAIKYPARQVITAGTDGEKTIESNDWCHGIFTFKLLEILKIEDKPVPASKLGALLKERIPRELASKYPDHSLTPQAKYLSGDGDFIFIRKDFKANEFDKFIKEAAVTKQAPKSEVMNTPTPSFEPSSGKSNVEARLALDELLQSFKDRNIPLDKQIVYLQDFISDWKGTGAANNAEGEINRVREIERLTEEAKKEYDGLLKKEEMEVLKKSQADVRKQLWEEYIKKYKDTDYQIAKAEERKQYWTIWKAVTPTPSPTPTPERPDTGYTEKIDLGQGVVLEMVYIRGGSFQMGSPETEKDKESDEGPVHTVTLSDFWIGKYEVTVGQFNKFVEETGYRTEAEKGDGSYIWTGSEWAKKSDANWRNPYFTQDNKNPIVCVSWNDAKAFCDWLYKKTGKRFALPTEAQWEYSCRAGSQTRFCFGDSDSGLGKYAWYNSNSGSKTHPVGGTNAWGLYDMHGNVWEWCQDWYHDNYNGAPRDGSAWESPLGSVRVLRGGSWYDYPKNCRSADRGWNYPAGRINYGGFRVCRGLVRP